MLTNFTTIKKRIGLLEQLEARQQAGDFERLSKKEAAKLTEELTKLQLTVGGMRKMKRVPGAVFIIDPHRERIAVTEANKLEVPVVATGDTNVDPDEIDHIIPANDDAIRSIRLLCTLDRRRLHRGPAGARVARGRRARAGGRGRGRARVRRVRLRRARRRPRRRRRPHVLAGRGGRGRAAAGRPRPLAEPVAPGRRGHPRRDRRRARPRGSREGRARNRRSDPRPRRAARHHRTSHQARTTDRSARTQEHANPDGRRSPPTRSRNCASAPAPA